MTMPAVLPKRKNAISVRMCGRTYRWSCGQGYHCVPCTTSWRGINTVVIPSDMMLRSGALSQSNLGLAAASRKCPYSWDDFGVADKCFLAVAKAFTWANALSNCERLSATLLELDNTGIHTGWLNRNSPYLQVMWLGGRSQNNGTLRWLSGRAIDNYSVHHRAPSEGSACVLFEGVTLFAISCGQEYPSICVKPSALSSSTGVVQVKAEVTSTTTHISTVQEVYTGVSASSTYIAQTTNDNEVSSTNTAQISISNAVSNDIHVFNTTKEDVYRDGTQTIPPSIINMTTAEYYTDLGHDQTQTYDTDYTVLDLSTVRGPTDAQTDKYGVLIKLVIVLAVTVVLLMGGLIACFILRIRGRYKVKREANNHISNIYEYINDNSLYARIECVPQMIEVIDNLPRSDTASVYERCSDTTHDIKQIASRKHSPQSTEVYTKSSYIDMTSSSIAKIQKSIAESDINSESFSNENIEILNKQSAAYFDMTQSKHAKILDRSETETHENGQKITKRVIMPQTKDLNADYTNMAQPNNDTPEKAGEVEEAIDMNNTSSEVHTYEALKTINNSDRDCHKYDTLKAPTKKNE